MTAERRLPRHPVVVAARPVIEALGASLVSAVGDPRSALTEIRVGAWVFWPALTIHHLGGVAPPTCRATKHDDCWRSRSP